MTRPTISDAIDGGAYLDVDGEVMTISQPHLQSNPDAPRATIISVWPTPGMPTSREVLRLAGTASPRQIAAALRLRGAARITARWQDS